MPHRSAFASELVHAHRPTRAGELRRAGVPRTSLANGAWRKVAHGLYTPAVDFVTTTQRILDVATQLTAPAAGGGRAAVGGWAAAYAWGVDRLDGVDPRTGKELPVDCVGQHLKRSSTAHVRYRRSPLVETEVATGSVFR